MIAHVFGEVAEKFNNSLIIDVSGIGYEVAVPIGDYDNVSLGDEIKFYTYHQVREQSEDLYGFSSLATKKVFELLITVQGVGPKAALAILSLGEMESGRNAIASSDSAYIQKAVGVGKKTAERVVVDLADKVGLPTRYGRSSEPAMESGATESDEALEALMALGYNLADAVKLLEKIDPALPTAQRVTEALRV